MGGATTCSWWVGALCRNGGWGWHVDGRSRATIEDVSGALLIAVWVGLPGLRTLVVEVAEGTVTGPMTGCPCRRGWVPLTSYLCMQWHTSYMPVLHLQYYVCSTWCTYSSAELYFVVNKVYTTSTGINKCLGDARRNTPAQVAMSDGHQESRWSTTYVCQLVREKTTQVAVSLLA